MREIDSLKLVGVNQVNKTGGRKTVAEKKVLLRQVKKNNKKKVFHTMDYVFDPGGMGWH